MALYEVQQRGFAVSCLATFAPPRPAFRAHPLAGMALQAAALRLPHRVLTVAEPFENAYEAGLSKLRNELGTEVVVTGDIAEVDGHRNWIRERSEQVGLDVEAPLWGRDRETLLRQLLDRGFRARISCVKTRWLDAEWVGRELDASAITELRAVRARTGLDLCGEDGEYHTLTVDGPCFTRAIGIRSYSTRTTRVLAHIDIGEMMLIDRDTAGR